MMKIIIFQLYKWTCLCIFISQFYIVSTGIPSEPDTTTYRTTTHTTTNYTPTTPPTTTPPSTTSTTTTPTTTPSPFDGKIWALLVAGSKGFDNYRHQADICHAYQILHENGIPDENIIVMMYDDIASNEDNPKQGVIINKPGGRNMYKNVLKDYTGSEVTPENFLNILKGDKAAMEGIGSGKVIKSGPNDHIFINFADHGAPGSLMFPDEELLADDLISVLKDLSESRKFSKMVLYVEACFSGSMFDSLLPYDTNIFATTAADPHESSYACYFDDELETYLGDVFSVNWMEDAEKEKLAEESLNRQYEIVRTETNTSHVEEYGDLDIGSTKLVKIIGKRQKNPGEKMKNKISVPSDAVPSLDVPINILKNKLQKTKNKFKRQEIKMKLHQIYKKRKQVDILFTNIVANIAAGDVMREADVNTLISPLTKEIFPCYRSLFTYFSENCFSVAKNPYVATHLQKFINFCSLPWSREPTMIDAMRSECSGWQKQFVGIHSIV